MKIIDNIANKLYLGTSKIPNAGVGLFSGIDIQSGVPVCEYKGEVIDTETEEGAIRLNEKYEYTLKLGFKKPAPLYGIKHAFSKMLIDAQPALTQEPTGLGAYVNDAAGWQIRMSKEYVEKLKKLGDDGQSTPTIGSELASEIKKLNEDLGYNLTYWPVTGETKILLLSIRDIKAGEELYVDYGINYWKPFIEKVLEDQKAENKDKLPESTEEKPKEVQNK